jgi:hypothetical protein
MLRRCIIAARWWRSKFQAKYRYVFRAELIPRLARTRAPLRKHMGAPWVPHGTSTRKAQREAAGEVFGVIENSLRQHYAKETQIIPPKGTPQFFLP